MKSEKYDCKDVGNIVKYKRMGASDKFLLIKYYSEIHHKKPHEKAWKVSRVVRNKSTLSFSVTMQHLYANLNN